MRDLMNNIHVTGTTVASVSDNTAIVSGIVDCLGFESLTFIIATGTLADADATFAVTMSHGEQSGLSDAEAVPADGLIGTTALASFTFADDNKVFKIGYRGAKRYVRLTVTPASNTGAAAITIVPVLGHPAQAPTANPPA